MGINIMGKSARLQMDKTATFVEKTANKIAALGLAGPAILLLEAHKPLAFVSSQLLLVAQPTLNIFLPRSLTRDMVDLLADSARYEQLITALEAGASPNSTAKEAGR